MTDKVINKESGNQLERQIDKDLLEIITIKRELRSYFYKLYYIFILITVIASFAIVYKNKSSLSQIYYKYNLSFNVIDRIFSTDFDKIKININGNFNVSEEQIINIFQKHKIAKINNNILNNILKDILKIPFVEKAFISRSLIGNVVNINIQEKKVIAISENNECDNESNCITLKKIVFDNASMSNYINFELKNTENILLVKNLNSPEEFINLYHLIQKFKLNDNIQEIISFKSGRWNLIFKNGLLIKLPRDNINKALLSIEELNNKYFILDERNYLKYIDLRVENKIFIRE